MASDQIYIPPETYVIGEVLSRWNKWRGLNWREKVLLMIAYIDHHPHREDFEIDDFREFAASSVRFPVEQQTVQHLLHAFYGFMAREHGYTDARWGDKTPWNTMHLDSILRGFPNGLFLHIMRDGRDSVASQIKADMRGIEDAAHRWIQANGACLKLIKPKQHRTLRVRYEDLVRRPEDTFSEIFGWAGLSYEPDVLTRMPRMLADVGRHAHHNAVTKPITDKSIGRWKDTLSEADFDPLPRQFAVMQAELGYA